MPFSTMHYPKCTVTLDMGIQSSKSLVDLDLRDGGKIRCRLELGLPCGLRLFIGHSQAITQTVKRIE